MSSNHISAAEYIYFFCFIFKFAFFLNGCVSILIKKKKVTSFSLFRLEVHSTKFLTKFRLLPFIVVVDDDNDDDDDYYEEEEECDDFEYFSHPLLRLAIFRN